MACCGESRRLMRQAARAVPPPARASRLSARRADPARSARGIYFEYTGPTGLTTHGAVTTRRYRFSGHGAVVLVDPLDADPLSTVPSVRRMI